MKYLAPWIDVLSQPPRFRGFWKRFFLWRQVSRWGGKRVKFWKPLMMSVWTPIVTRAARDK